MASKSTGRSLHNAIKRAKPSCECASLSYPRNASIRQISASTSRRNDMVEGERPKWSYTPDRMKAPMPWKPINPEKRWKANEDPARLDTFYNTFLGRGGDTVLSDDVKWLAVTHKSFDQGRRGFNDRLAFLGRRILHLQTTMALVNSPIATQTQLPSTDSSPESHTHPALEGLANLSNVPLQEILTKQRIGALATEYGMRDVIRWQPKNMNNLDGSGIDVVLTTTVFAIIGAIALQKGGAVAAEVAKEKVLKRLGIS